MQDRGEAYLGLKALIVPGKLEQSSGGRVKEEIKDEYLIEPGQGLEDMQATLYRVAIIKVILSF